MSSVPPNPSSTGHNSQSHTGATTSAHTNTNRAVHLTGTSNSSNNNNNMSTQALENQMKQLREQSDEHSRLLTQKLASSKSGQNLLHIGTSLSTLPPDLHTLLTNIHPLLAATEQLEQDQIQALQELVQHANKIRHEQYRVEQAQDCATLYRDLLSAEHCVSEQSRQGHSQRTRQRKNGNDNDASERNDDDDDDDDELAAGEDELADEELDQAFTLEVAAMIALRLLEQVRQATETVAAFSTAGGGTREPEGNGTSTTTTTTLPTMRAFEEGKLVDNERAQFVLKLAPRIRRLESDAVRCLTQRMEVLLRRLQAIKQAQLESSSDTSDPTTRLKPTSNQQQQQSSEQDLLLMLGHCMRGLAVLGRGAEVESVFARVAIMPLIRSKISMGRLDEGGSRGECKGLPSLLDEMIESIRSIFGVVLVLAEGMFCVDEVHDMDVDLLTAGVWVPISAALMADAGIKMAIFSPGIASILQSNYIALDKFLSELSYKLLGSDQTEVSGSTPADLFFHPTITPERVQEAQERIYSHPKTSEFSKKWNLPIYYQLRFGECCTRLNKAVDKTSKEGWVAEVFSGSKESAEKIKHDIGFELSLFLELHDILLGLWRPDVILKPLTNRFLRGAVQLIGRIVSFVEDGMEGKVTFGGEPASQKTDEGNESTNGLPEKPSFPSRTPYCWGETEQDVAAVSWELTILDSTIRHDYVETICNAIAGGTSTSGTSEIRGLVSDVLKESSERIQPLIDRAWNEQIVKILTSKCSAPLAAVKGVAATYRMTNRPPPTQASPFVITILRPLKEFCQEFVHRTPERVGARWKHQIVVTVTDRYAAAVEELIATVERTELALNSRRARRTAAGGMRDGEKVKLQLYLDYKTYAQTVQEVGVDPASVIGLSKLEKATADGEDLLNKTENGS